MAVLRLPTPHFPQIEPKMRWERVISRGFLGGMSQNVSFKAPPNPFPLIVTKKGCFKAPHTPISPIFPYNDLGGAGFKGLFLGGGSRNVGFKAPPAPRCPCWC